MGETADVEGTYSNTYFSTIWQYSPSLAVCNKRTTHFISGNRFHPL